MEQIYLNSRELRDFISTHELIDRSGNIFFNAVVSIDTKKNKIRNKLINVMITLDGYDSLGQINLLDSKLDPYLYPTVFDAKWQIMNHINDQYLEIRGNHLKNADIGQYLIQILPLEKLNNPS
ncbi:hypothetical protein H9Y05_15830 [Crocinitomicaceae bacterium CZZ-1]|uniref:Uncharacterized protein n=1 Tax=Taishania pollutisoli TaxID=2766479 RepID=A0A8J6PER3_9FLAO|nr:hypothetical protein [Taishania pollutisoli]MBC9813947.1 hypothetical protein [Taishania pollutisoli]